VEGSPFVTRRDDPRVPPVPKRRVDVTETSLEMVYSRGRATLAVVQAVACLTLAGCGGGGDAADDSQFPQSDEQEQEQEQEHALAAPAHSSGAKITLHSATVSWTAPVQNTDGTPLTDVAGYIIRYGKSPTSLTKSIVVSDPGLTTGTVGGLRAGTYFFSVATRNSAGAMSTASNLVSKTVP